MLIWILQTGEPIYGDDKKYQPMRAKNLTESLIKKGHKVILISSNFFHQEKKNRFQNLKTFKKIEIKKNLIQILIPSTGYKKNVSIKRIYDHLVLGINLNNFLKTDYALDNKPDKVFIGYPPCESALFISKWCKKFNIPYIVDVKDLWPEVFLENKRGLEFIFVKLISLYFDALNYFIFKYRGGMVTISDYFLKFLEKKFSNKNVNNEVIYLTKPVLKDKLNFNQKRKIKKIIKKNHFNILFVGNLSDFFNFETLIKCSSYMDQKNIKHKFLIAGPDVPVVLKKIQILKKKYNAENFEYIGFVDSLTNIDLMNKADIFIAPIRNTPVFKKSIPNKIINCIQLGVPFLTPLIGQVSKIVEENQIGLIYDENDHLSLYEKIFSLIKNKKKIEIMKKNINTYKKKYDHDENYRKLTNLLEKLD